MPRIPLLFSLLLFAASVASANVVFSPDTAVDLGGTVVFDDEAAEDSGGVANLITIGNPGDVPEETDVNGYDAYSGDTYFTTDTTVELPGGVVATPAMVVRESGGLYSIEFDGAVLPAGVTVDAVFAFSNGDLALSFDTTAEVSSTVFADEDLALWDGASMSMYVDMSSHGVPTAMDLDGVAPGAGDVVYVSFDVSGTLGGVDFDDEDILGLDTGTSTWSLDYDGSAAFASLAPVDVIAVPEPAAGVSALSGALMIGALLRRRRSGVANR